MRADDSVDAVMMPVVVQHEGPLFGPGNAVGKIAPPERGFLRAGARFGVNLLPDVSGKMVYHLLDKRIIPVVVNALPPL